MVKEQAMLLSMKIHQTRNRRCKGSGAGAGEGLVYSQNIKDVDRAGEKRAEAKLQRDIVKQI